MSKSNRKSSNDFEEDEYQNSENKNFVCENCGISKGLKTYLTTYGEMLLCKKCSLELDSEGELINL